jgi:hypothetical protein
MIYNTIVKEIQIEILIIKKEFIDQVCEYITNLNNITSNN